MMDWGRGISEGLHKDNPNLYISNREGECETVNPLWNQCASL